MMMTVQQTAPFSGLLLFAVSRYSFPAAAKSAAGRENPSLTVATPDAPCVFFCVYAFAHPFIGQRFFVCCAVKIMVAQAGQPSGWPVSIVAGDEHTARLSLVRDYVLSFAGRLPVAEVRA
ncbi:host cell division inhibitor Icd-like protein [Salmonella enterica]|nr:host cell division inhibitor Icd-like protein [Salmonella enterica]